MKSKRLIGGAVLLLLAGSAATTLAQYDPYIYGYSGMMGGGYGGYGGGGYGHASTYEEGVQRGYADVIRSRGAANLMNSEAAGNWADAQSKYIENRQQYTQAYFEMRQMNRQYRAAEAGPKPTQEDIYRYAKDRAPDRLSPSQLDPLTATINWPLALRGAEFEDQRQQMEELFAKRSTPEGMSSPDTYLAINQLGSQMQSMLKSHIGEYPNANIYLESKKFLDGLVYESALQPSS